MPVILAHRKWRREDQKLKIILGYIGSLKSVFHIRPYLSEVTGIVKGMETERSSPGEMKKLGSPV